MVNPISVFSLCQPSAGIPVVAWPVNATCARILSDPSDPVLGLAYGIGTFYNATGDKICYNISTDVPNWGACCGW